MHFEFTPGGTSQALAQWPSLPVLTPRTNRAQLIAFVHPKCPCTRATVDELAQLAGQCPAPLDVWIFVFCPAEADPRWAHTPLWEQASLIPGAVVQEDPAGAVAERFGAHTSGHLMLYDAAGTLLFSGGITGSRGSASANPGLDALSRSLREPTVRRQAWRGPVFGCSLQNDTADASTVELAR